MPTIQQRSYLIVLLFALLLPALALIIASYRLDPFWLYDTSAESTTTLDENAITSASRTDLFWYLRLHKAYRMQERSAQHLILGSSRTGRLAPEFLNRSGDVVYNASMPGTTIKEIYRLLEHGQAIEPLRSVIIGIDYFMFRDDVHEFSPLYYDARLFKANMTYLDYAKHYWQKLNDIWSTLLSRSAITANYRTISPIDAHRKRDFFPNGTWETYPRENAGQWVFSYMAKQKYDEFSELSQQLDFSKLEQLLSFCVDNNIKLTLLISPSHAHIMNTINRTNRWDSYLAFQRGAVAISETYRAQGGAIEIFGLETVEPMIFEPVTPDYHWFNDGIHYTKAAGAEIMRCLLPSDTTICQKAFEATRLSSNTIDAYLQAVTRNMHAYEQRVPASYDMLDKQIKRLQKKVKTAL